MIRHLSLKIRPGLRIFVKQCQVQSGNATFARIISRHHRKFHTSKYLQKLTAVKPFILTDIGEGIRQVVIKEWFVKVGDEVEQFDDICDVESDKASVKITSKYKGTVRKIYYEADATALVGQPLVDIEVEDDTAEEQTRKEPEKAPVEEKTEKEVKDEISPSTERAVSGSENVNENQANMTADEKLLATPAVRRLLREIGIRLEDIHGSGKDGRVLKEDVLSYIENHKNNRIPNVVSDIGLQQSTQISQDLVYRVEGLTKHMVRCMTVSGSIPALLYCDEVNVTTLARWRTEFKEILAKRDISISFLPYMIKALSLSLLKYPILNSTLDEKCEKITYKSAHNIGFAVATTKGLLVPNIKNVKNLSILQIALEMKRLQSLAHAGSLTPSDITGGTITLSNLGSIGGIYYRPMINPPEMAIGAIGKMQVLPRYNTAGEVEKTKIMNISWTADHRIIDGATMASFSNTWKDYMENPATLLFGLV